MSNHTCPTCGQPVRVVGDPIEGTMHYQPTFTEAMVELVAEGLRERFERWGVGGDGRRTARGLLGRAFGDAES